MEHLNGCLTFIILTFINVICGQNLEAVYSMEEETGPDYYLGKVAADAGLTTDNKSDITLRYSLLTTGNPVAGLFSINERTSSLYTSTSLDRDDVCSFIIGACVLKFEVVAQGQLDDFFQKIKVEVTLIDKNDNIPRFPSNESFIDISENSVVGTTFTLPGATDEDSGNNSVQSYKIKSEGVPFKLEENTYSDGRTILKIIVTQDLNRELASKYTFKILAIDGGKVRNTGTSTVHITITDINDNSPKFSKPVYNVTVPEDIVKDTVILKFNATDPDEGENGRVLYKLSSHQSDDVQRLFKVNITTGELSVIGSFIHERSQSYRIIVEASDNATQPLISQAQVFVTILDTHNNPPEITLNLLSQTYYVEAPESSAVGTVLAIVSVADPDSGDSGNVSCSVNDDHFRLVSYDDIYEYNFELNKKLDRETLEWHTILVQCNDHGNPPLGSSATFSVRVLDMNDNPPKFSRPIYRIQVPENGPFGISILQVQATDVDVVNVANFSFSIDSENDYPGMFSIDRTSGIIKAQTPLDRETHPVISFKVFAGDGDVPPLTGTAAVEIQVKDENDNRPQFTPSAFEFIVPENQLPNVSIGKLVAKDADDGDNGKVTFSMPPDLDSNLPFKVLSNGTILGEITFDREDIERYDFKVIASDQGQSSLSSTANVTIFVQDLNDNAPVITFPVADGDAISVGYTTLPNTVIGNIRAHDVDDGQNSKLTFFIQDVNLTKLFTLNRFTGQLMLRRTLSFEDVGRYDVPLMVQDNGQPPRFRYRSLVIVITDDEGGTTEPEGQIKYFTIAIAISCVTVVLSVLIILAICLIRRSEKGREKYPESVTTNSTTDTDPANPDIRINGIYTRETLQKSLQSDTLSRSQDTYEKPSNTLPKGDNTSSRADNQLRIPGTMEGNAVNSSPSRLHPQAISSEVSIWDWSENDPVVGVQRPEPPVYMYQHPGRHLQQHPGIPRQQTFVPLYHDQHEFSLPSGVESGVRDLQCLVEYTDQVFYFKYNLHGG